MFDLVAGEDEGEKGELNQFWAMSHDTMYPMPCRNNIGSSPTAKLAVAEVHVVAGLGPELLGHGGHAQVGTCRRRSTTLHEVVVGRVREQPWHGREALVRLAVESFM